MKVAGVDVYLSRTGYGGELGFELFLTDPSDAEEPGTPSWGPA